MLFLTVLQGELRELLPGAAEDQAKPKRDDWPFLNRGSIFTGIKIDWSACTRKAPTYDMHIQLREPRYSMCAWEIIAEAVLAGFIGRISANKKFVASAYYR